MSYASNIPAGAQDRPDAPWNESQVDYLGRPVLQEEEEIQCRHCYALVKEEGDLCPECQMEEAVYHIELRKSA